MDEPTGDLDSRSTIEVMNLVLEINNFGHGGGEQRTTVVMVTHNEDLECYGDRIIFFEDGSIRSQAFNDHQFALHPEEYSKYLNSKI
jgi:putative ABC transport system ATP-binding protein